MTQRLPQARATCKLYEMFKQWLAAIVLASAACGDNGNNTHTKLDGASIAIDALVDAVAIDAKPDSVPVAGTSMTNVLYLNAEGVTLHPGADDATTDTSSLVTATVTLKPWLVGASDRTARIAAVVSGIRSVYSPYAVTVVTVRPTTGAYHELVITDDDGTAVVQNGAGIGALIPTACGAKPSVPGVIFAEGMVGGIPKLLAVNLAVPMFAHLSGMPLSKVGGDCMCFTDLACFATMSSQQCTIGGAGTTIDQSNGGILACGETAATMDERARFASLFGTP